jgi:hypothetical protein
VPRHTLFAYVDGFDLHGIAEGLEAEFVCFVAQSIWARGKPWVVNQRRDDDPSLGPDDLPDWEVGLNMELPDPGDEPAGWFADVERRELDPRQPLRYRGIDSQASRVDRRKPRR